MSQFGMLDCANNFHVGYRSKNCTACNVLDDENHRINHCFKFRKNNLFYSSVKVDFESINSGDEETTSRVLEVVCDIWELKNGKNTMRIS